MPDRDRLLAAPAAASGGGNVKRHGDETDPLVPRAAAVGGVEERVWWQTLHAFAFVLGGVLFCWGTACYFWPNWEQGGVIAGWVYTIGSCGFLTVDVMEFFTFTADTTLRVNIAMSATGSALYVIGSVGFIPSVYAVTDRIGVWGFILGSAFIGVSQLWKTHRIARTASLAAAASAALAPAGSGSGNGHGHERGVAVVINRDGGGAGGGATKAEAEAEGDVKTRCSAMCGSAKSATAAGVELNAGLGAWCFFVGTVLYDHIGGDPANAWWNVCIIVWQIGSVFFTAGGLCLTYRHAVMRVV